MVWKTKNSSCETCSKHVTFYKVDPCEELSFQNHVSRTRIHNNNHPCNWMRRQLIPWLMIPFLLKCLWRIQWGYWGLEKVLPLKKFLQPKRQCVGKYMDNPVKVNFIFQILHIIMRISYAHHFFLCMLLICGSHSKEVQQMKTSPLTTTKIMCIKQI